MVIELYGIEVQVASPDDSYLVNNSLRLGEVKNVAKQMMDNPNIEICAMYEGKWIRVEGKAKEDDRTVARKAMLDAYPDLRSMYDENDGNTAVFVIDNAVATIYSFTEDPVVYRF